MRRLGLAAVLCVLSLAPARADQASALESVRAQPRVVNAQMDTAGNMYVLVKPEKVQWKMFAGAVCSLVKPHQGRIFRVRVIEVTQANYGKPPATWPRLAEADCSN
jgi:hypothetical protein